MDEEMPSLFLEDHEEGKSDEDCHFRLLFRPLSYWTPYKWNSAPHPWVVHDAALTKPDVCRVCRLEADEENPMVHPCKCSGSVRYVHPDCLKSWLATSQKRHCEICGHKYTFTKVYPDYIPSIIPPVVYIRQGLFYLFGVVVYIHRIWLVIAAWLLILPYVNLKGLRGFLWFANLAIAGFVPPDLIPPTLNATAVTKATEPDAVQNLTAAVGNITQSKAEVLELVLVSQLGPGVRVVRMLWQNYRSWTTGLAPPHNLSFPTAMFVFRGQILSIILAAIIIALIFLREWASTYNWAQHNKAPPTPEEEINPDDWIIVDGQAKRLFKSGSILKRQRTARARRSNQMTVGNLRASQGTNRNDGIEGDGGGNPLWPERGLTAAWQLPSEEAAEQGHLGSTVNPMGVRRHSDDGTSEYSMARTARYPSAPLLSPGVLAPPAPPLVRSSSSPGDVVAFQGDTPTQSSENMQPYTFRPPPLRRKFSALHKSPTSSELPSPLVYAHAASDLLASDMQNRSQGRDSMLSSIPQADSPSQSRSENDGVRMESNAEPGPGPSSSAGKPDVANDSTNPDLVAGSESEALPTPRSSLERTDQPSTPNVRSFLREADSMRRARARMAEGRTDSSTWRAPELLVGKGKGRVVTPEVASEAGSPVSAGKSDREPSNASGPFSPSSPVQVHRLSVASPSSPQLRRVNTTVLPSDSILADRKELHTPLDAKNLPPDDTRLLEPGGSATEAQMTFIQNARPLLQADAAEMTSYSNRWSAAVDIIDETGEDRANLLTIMKELSARPAVMWDRQHKVRAVLKLWKDEEQGIKVDDSRKQEILLEGDRVMRDWLEEEARIDISDASAKSSGSERAALDDSPASRVTRLAMSTGGGAVSPRSGSDYPTDTYSGGSTLRDPLNSTAVRGLEDEASDSGSQHTNVWPRLNADSTRSVPDPKPGESYANDLGEDINAGIPLVEEASSENIHAATPEGLVTPTPSEPDTVVPVLENVELAVNNPGIEPNPAAGGNDADRPWDWGEDDEVAFEDDDEDAAWNGDQWHQILEGTRWMSTPHLSLAAPLIYTNHVCSVLMCVVIGLVGPISSLFHNLCIAIAIMGATSTAFLTLPMTAGKLALCLDPIRSTLEVGMLLWKWTRGLLVWVRVLTDPIVDVFWEIGRDVILKPAVMALSGAEGILARKLGLAKRGPSSAESSFSAGQKIASFCVTRLEAFFGAGSEQPANSSGINTHGPLTKIRLPQFIVCRLPFTSLSDSLSLDLDHLILDKLANLGQKSYCLYQGCRNVALQIAMGDTLLDNVLSLIMGYTVLVIVTQATTLYLEHGRTSASDAAKTKARRWNMFNKVSVPFLTAIINPVMKQLAFFLFLELVVFPFGVGLLINICTVPLFLGASISNRMDLIQSGPCGQIFIMWLIGTMFMYGFAQILTWIRSMSRPGALYFIRDPHDPKYSPIKDMIERPSLSQARKLSTSTLMYGFLVWWLFGAIPWGLRFLPLDKVLPLRLDGYRPLSSIPYDYLVLLLAVPPTIKHLRPQHTIKRFLRVYWRYSVRWFRLSNLIRVTKPKPDMIPIGRVESLFWAALDPPFRSMFGKYDSSAASARVPAEDSVLLLSARSKTGGYTGKRETMFVPLNERGQPKNPENKLILLRQDAIARKAGRDPKKDFTVVSLPDRWRTRVHVFILFTLGCSGAFLASSVLVPILVGRFMLRSWFGEVHDGLSFLTGSYVLYAGVLLGRKAQRSVLAQAKAKHARMSSLSLRMKRHLRECLQRGYVLVGLYLVHPLLRGLVWELRLGLLVRYGASEGASVVHIWDAWALGAVIDSLELGACGLFGRRLGTGDHQMHRLFRHPFQDDFKTFNKTMIPNLLHLIIRITLPFVFTFVVGITAYEVDDDFRRFQFRISGVTTWGMYEIAANARYLIAKIREARQAMIDAEYVVEERVENYTPSESQEAEAEKPDGAPAEPIVIPLEVGEDHVGEARILPVEGGPGDVEIRLRPAHGDGQPHPGRNQHEHANKDGARAALVQVDGQMINTADEEDDDRRRDIDELLEQVEEVEGDLRRRIRVGRPERRSEHSDESEEDDLEGDGEEEVRAVD